MEDIGSAPAGYLIAVWEARSTKCVRFSSAKGQRSSVPNLIGRYTFQRHA